MKNENRDFKGVWIPKEIWLNKDLTITEKCLLVEIDSLDKGEGCFASNEYLAEFLNSTETSVAKMVSRLRQRGYIIDKKFDGRKRWISVEMSNIPVKADLSKSKGRPGQKVNPDVSKSKHSNTVNNTSSNNKESVKEKFTPLSKKFIKPSIHEIQIYMTFYMVGKPETIDITNESEKYFDHFESNGWKVGGRGNMKDWKASVRNWIKNIKTFQNGTNQKHSEKSTTHNYIGAKYPSI